MLYELKAAQEEKRVQTMVSPEPYTVHHPGIRADWFKPVTNLKELVQLGKADTRKLLQSIAASGRYDVVIADTDSGPNERLAAVLEGCRHLVWLMLDDITNLYKNGQWFAFMERSQPELFAELAGKSRYVVNRFTGQLANPLPACIPEVDGVLPYTPSWKQNSNEELLLSSPIYQRDILKLCKSLLGDSFVSGSGVRGYG